MILPLLPRLSRQSLAALRPYRKRCAARGMQRGFTLVEMAIVLTVLGLLTGGGAMYLARQVAQKAELKSRQSLSNASDALQLYALQTNRLPCPDVPPHDGLEDRAGSGECTDKQAMGVLPWRSLGLMPGDSMDGWNRRLTYRVAPALTHDQALSPALCKGGNTSQPCLNGAIGLRVDDPQGQPLANPATTPPTGAGWVLVSAGPNGIGGITVAGALTPGETGAHETPNRADQPVGAHPYIMAPRSADDAPPDIRYDDLLIWRTVPEIRIKITSQP